MEDLKNYEMMNDTEKWNFLSAVANLYYNSDMTQNEIADRFYTSRSKISRMLKEARRIGVVEITIHEPWERNSSLEQEFMETFSLKHVRIISVKEQNSSYVLQKLGEAAAYYLDSIINKNTILGMSWGNTVYHTVQAIKTSKNIPLTVVPIMGAAITHKPERDSLDLSKELAASYGGTYHYIYAPLFVKSKTLRESLIQEPNIKKTLDLARRANVILTSVGSIASKSWKDFIQPGSLEKLSEKGAIGHIGGHFYDIQGQEILTSLSQKMIGIDLDDIRKVDEVICVAGMEEKAEAVLGAVRGGYIDTLIIDQYAARRMLELNRSYNA